MMTKGEHIFTLMTMRLAGELPPDEAAELDALIQSDPDLQERWKVLCAGFDAKDIDSQFERFHANAGAPAPRRTSRTLRYVMLGGTAAAVLAGLAWFAYLSPSPMKTSTADKFQEHTSAGVTLSTAAGQTIDVAQAGTIDGWQAEADREALRITSADETSGWNRLSVPPGLTYRVVLPDGSKIWLNSASQLQFPGSFPGKERRVRMQGEAWMEIHPDPAKAFIVETDGMEVTVLGTDFNLKAYPSGPIQLSLVNGAVIAAADNKQVTLKPGQQASLSGGELRTGLFDETETTGWRQGKYYFQQTSLTEIAAIIDRAYGLKTIFDDPSTALQTFSGMLNQQKPLKVFLENLHSTAAINYYFDKNGMLHIQ